MKVKSVYDFNFELSDLDIEWLEKMMDNNR